MSNKVELVVIPAPGMGHLVSMLQLAKLVLQTNQHISISIYIINLPIPSTKITAYVDSQSRDNPYPTRLTFIILPPLTNLPDPSAHIFFVDLIELNKPLVKQVVEDRVRDGLPKPIGFVLDMFCTTMVDIAIDLNVPSYVFFTSGASLLNFVFYVGSLYDDHGLEARDLSLKISDLEFSSVVAGFKNQVTSRDIPAGFKDEFGSEMILNFARQFKKMKGILVNSYIELESFAFESLYNNKDKKMPAVYPVGPIMDLTKGRSDDKEKDSIIEWLDHQPKSSVAFLCFGSMGSFKEEQVKEIANGLDKSGHRFLWALRKPPQAGASVENEMFLEALPDGFLGRTCNRGKVIGWAPQVDVLSNPAIGGFVSHCGWNSTLESIWFGVPIGAWPMYAEQQLNAFELVKELELAVEIIMDYDLDWKVGKANYIVKAKEIEEGIMKLMNIDENIKGNVKEMSEKGKKALENGGSSYRWLGRFIEDILANIKN